MSTTTENIERRVEAVLRSTFRISPDYAVTPATSSADVDGWDSLSHAVFLMAVESEFGVEIPLDEAYALPDLGALVSLLARLTKDVQRH